MSFIISIKCLGIHLQEFLGLLVYSSSVLKPKRVVDAFADGSHCPLEGLDWAVDITTYGLHELNHSFLQSCDGLCLLDHARYIHLMIDTLIAVYFC